jgi:outer membrane protein
MRTRLLFKIVLFILSALPALAQQSPEWDLKRCVDYALANNISVKQQDVQARLSALTLNQNKLNRYPTASVGVNTGINAGRSIDPTTNQFTNQQLFFAGASFSTGVTVFNFFSLKNTIAGNQYDYEASRAWVDKMKNDIALNVATAYLLVLLAQEQVDIAKVTATQSGQTLANTRKRVDAGALPELNAAEAEAKLVSDSATLISFQATLEQNMLQLKAVMNLDAAAPFVVVLPPIDKVPVENIAELQPESVYQLALVNLPQQRVNDLRIKAGEKYVQSARGAMYPTFSLFGSMGSNYAHNKIPVYTETPTGGYSPTTAKVSVSGTDYFVQTPVILQSIGVRYSPLGTQLSDNFSQRVGLNVSIPLFSNGTLRTSWERNKLNLLGLQLQKDQDNITLKQNIYKAYSDAVAALHKYEASKRSEETAERSYDYARKRYDVGLLATIDLLTNQNNLTTAKVNTVSSHVDYVFKIKVLEFYKGQGLKLQ